jgi:hypothetical protein
MAELREVFDRGFSAVFQAAEAEGVAISGPPFGFYPRMPGDTVEVVVGFPWGALSPPTAKSNPSSSRVAGWSPAPTSAPTKRYRDHRRAPGR